MKRPYKKAWSVEDFITEIRNGSSRHFDPRLIDVFCEVIPGVLRVKEKWGKQEVNPNESPS